MNTLRTTDKPVGMDVLLNQVTVTGPGKPVTGAPRQRTFQAELDGAGATATVVIEGSNTGVKYVPIGTITLTSAAPTEGFYFDAPWGYVRANVTAISSAGAAVTCAMGS